jgi:hypothetical protein
VRLLVRHAVATCALSLLAGCSFDKIAANSMTPVLRRTEVEFERSRTVKAAREAAPGLLVTLDGIVATSPDNPDLLELAAQMNATFAFGFLEETDPSWATELYEKAQRYAGHALELRDSSVAKEVELPTKDKPKLDPIDEDVVPSLFWLGFAWGSRINLNRSNEKLLGDLDKVDRAMQAVLDKDEAFFDGGPHLYFGVRYTSLSKSLGGNPSEGKKHFDAVDRITQNKFLMSRVLRAKFYSASLGDVPSNASIEQMAAAQKAAWDDFFATLKSVLDAKDDLWPEKRLQNELAKDKAKKLLARPEDANINVPDGVENPYSKKKDD